VFSKSSEWWATNRLCKSRSRWLSVRSSTTSHFCFNWCFAAGTPRSFWDTLVKTHTSQRASGEARQGLVALGSWHEMVYPAGAQVSYVMGVNNVLRYNLGTVQETPVEDGNGQMTLRYLRPGQRTRIRVTCLSVDNLCGFFVFPASVVSNRTLTVADWGAGLPLYTVAADGITLSAMTVATGYILGPGQRQDCILTLPDPGQYHVVSGDLTGLSHGKEDTGRRILADILVAGAPVNASLMPLLTGLALPGRSSIASEEPSVRRVITMDVIVDDVDSVPSPSFTMNMQSFDTHRVDVVQQSDTDWIEEWTIISTGSAHPLHVHVNPFQVTKVADPQHEGPTAAFWGNDAQLGVWRDTVVIPALGQVRTRCPTGNKCLRACICMCVL